MIAGRSSPAQAEDGSSPPKHDEQEATQAHILRSAGVVSAAVFLSRITGLIREVVFARFFGASLEYDAFIAAFRIPNLFRDLLAEGALSAAFVTAFSQTHSRKGEAEAFALSNRLATVLTPFISILCLLGIVFAPQLVDLVYPGYAEIAGKKDLTVALTRIMTPFLLFVALAAKAMGVLNARSRFAVPALASAVFNLTSLSSGLVLGFVLGPELGLRPIVGMAVGTLLGGACQYLFQVPSLRREGLRYRWQLALSDPGLRQVLRLMGPAVVGAAAVQVNVVVNSNFASQITNEAGQIIDGPVSWLSYAFRFMQLPLGLFGVAVASATLPAISRSAGEGRIDDFRATVSRSLGLVFLFTIPSAAGLIVLSQPIVGLVYERGRFSAFDTEQTALALSFYCLGLAGYAAIKVLTPAFYALNDVRVPVATSVGAIVVNYVLNWTFLRVLDWGHWGLAFATSLVAIFNFLVLLAFLAKKTHGLGARRLLDSGMRVAVATAAMAAVAALLSATIEAQLGSAFWARAANVGLSSAGGLLALYQTAKLLRVPELAFAEQMVRGRLRRAFR